MRSVTRAATPRHAEAVSRPYAARGSVLGTIGNTPLLELRNLDTGCCRLFVKLENQNPTGSIKDRIGLSMIEAAERDGHLRPGGDPPITIIEATAGNTGLGLALVAAQKGYRLLLVIPDKMSQEKILHLRALGAQIHLTRSDVGQGPSRALPGPARRGWRARRPTASTSISSPIPPIRWRTRPPPDRRSGRRPGRCSMRWWSASAAAAR